MSVVGKWFPHEDELLVEAVRVYGDNWVAVSEDVPGRTRKQCRDRWLVHSRSQNHAPLSTAEQVRFIDLHRQFGSQWRRLAQQMPDRSQQHLKNLYATRRRAKAPGAERLLHDYAHGAPGHSLAGLDGPLVLAALPTVRDREDEQRWCPDVRAWWDISVEGRGHVYAAEVPTDPPLPPCALEEDLRVGLDMYRAAADTVGQHATRLMLATTGYSAFVGIADPDEGVALALGQMTVRTWQLERRARCTRPPVVGSKRLRRLTM